MDDPRPRERLDPNDAASMAMWAERWGLTVQQVRCCIAMVGTRIVDLEHALGRASFKMRVVAKSDAPASETPSRS